MMTWFEEDAFWAGFHDVLFGPERWERVPREVDLVLERLEPAPGSAVLDLCCGPGRHALELARRGFRVTGVDRTHMHIEEAQRRSAQENLAVEWVVEDMRRFVRPGAFDAAVNLYTSFGYFEDPGEDLLVARNLRTSLRPGGCLLLDLLSKEILARIFRPRDWVWLDRDRGEIFLEERVLAPDFGWIETTWTLLRNGERFVRTFHLRLYSATGLQALLKEAGFSSVEVFGSLAGDPFTPEPKRLVVVARTG